MYSIVPNLQNLIFNYDKAMVKNYISSRLLKEEILDIHSTICEDLSLIEHNILRNAQPTAIDVERSFSKLKNYWKMIDLFSHIMSVII